MSECSKKHSGVTEYSTGIRGNKCKMRRMRDGGESSKTTIRPENWTIMKT